MDTHIPEWPLYEHCLQSLFAIGLQSSMPSDLSFSGVTWFANVLEEYPSSSDLYLTSSLLASIPKSSTMFDSFISVPHVALVVALAAPRAKCHRTPRQHLWRTQAAFNLAAAVAVTRVRWRSCASRRWESRFLEPGMERPARLISRQLVRKEPSNMVLLWQQVYLCYTRLVSGASLWWQVCYTRDVVEASLFGAFYVTRGYLLE